MKKGKSIRRRGSEGGLIIRDEESTLGARVTLEGKGNIAPFSITLGIYGLMFHTEFFSDLEHAVKCFNLYKLKINEVLQHYSTDQASRNKEWNERHNQLMEEILSIATDKVD